MADDSAGVLLYRVSAGALEVLLVHPGGPFWRNKQIGAWQLPKGLIGKGEAAEAAARREVEEELGSPVNGALQSLGTIRQASGKIVHGFAVQADFDPASLRSNTFDMEWPPRSGRMAQFPEIDEARWMTLADADKWILPSQRLFLDRLQTLLEL